MIRILALLAAAGLGALGQGPPSNLDFEQGSPGSVPPGWFVPKTLQAAGYTAALTREDCRTGTCAVISVPETRPPNTFGNLMASVDATPYRGKLIVFRAAVRVDGADSGGFGALWVRVDRTPGTMGFFDNMSDRPIRSKEWTFYEIRGVVADDARTLNYGVMTQGNSRVWIDDVSLETQTPRTDGPEVSAIRQELTAIYAKIDAAYNSGAFDSMRAFAAPGAKFGSVMMRMPLEEGLTRIKSDLGGGKLMYKTEITSVELLQDEARVQASSLMTLTKDGISTTRKGRNSDTWVRVGGGWRFKEALLLSSAEVLPPGNPETTRIIAAELKKHASPLQSVEAGNSFADLEAFGKAVGDARIVALGEATHGTREIFQMKHRLLEYLVRNKGFTVFAIEANWPEAQAADRYIKTGEGDPKAALAAMYFWTWQTEEVLAMIEWMREFNKAPGKHPILSFTSFDMQTYDVAKERVLAYMKRYAPSEHAAVQTAYGALEKLSTRSMSDPGFAAAAAKAEEVTDLMQKLGPTLVKASAAEEFRDGLQMSRIVAQAARMRVPGAGGSYRDQMMAANVEWLAKQAHPNEKIVLWAHNGHVSANQSAGFRPMGSWLRESSGLQMYVLGFAINSGTVRASTREDGRFAGLMESRISPSADGSGSGVLAAAGQPRFFLDMRRSSGPLSKWLSEPHLFRSCGAVWDRDNPDAHMGSEVLSRAYDGLIYLDVTQAARGIAR